MKESTRKNEEHLEEQRDIHQAMLDKAAVDDWNDRGVAHCKDTGEPVMKVHPGSTAEQATEAKALCAKVAAWSRQSSLAQARVRCVNAVIESDWRAKPVCDVTKPPGVDAAGWAKDSGECSRACAEEVKVQLAEAKRAGEFRSRRVKCCDGTRSAHCTYNNMDDLRGACCLNHGGNCVESE